MATPFIWLFSPALGNQRWPGDLWGVDCQGGLLILEAKTCTVGRRCDPFEDFVGDGRLAVRPGAASIQAELLRVKWSRLFKCEQTFIDEHCDDLRAGVRFSGCYPGVVPYARHRIQVQRWRTLYTERVAPALKAGDYKRHVQEYLDTRERRKNPAPHFVGLAALVGGASFALSTPGLCHYSALRALAGQDTCTLSLWRADGRAQRTLKSFRGAFRFRLPTAAYGRHLALPGSAADLVVRRTEAGDPPNA